MTKLVFLSDTHGMHRRVNVPDGDIIVHCGDCTNQGTDEAFCQFITWFGRLPHKHKVLIAGNHDWCCEKKPSMVKGLSDDAGVNYLCDSAAQIEGLKFWGSPYSPRFFDWAFNVDRGPAIAAHWDKIPNETDVLVTHGPPLGFCDQTSYRGNRDPVGCRDLRDAMYRVEPEVHCFGHVHSGYGSTTYIGDMGHKTTLINASCCNEAYIPKNAPFIFHIP